MQCYWLLSIGCWCWFWSQQLISMNHSRLPASCPPTWQQHKQPPHFPLAVLALISVSVVSVCCLHPHPPPSAPSPLSAAGVDRLPDAWCSSTDLALLYVPGQAPGCTCGCLPSNLLLDWEERVGGDGGGGDGRRPVYCWKQVEVKAPGGCLMWKHWIQVRKGFSNITIDLLLFSGSFQQPVPSYKKYYKYTE